MAAIPTTGLADDVLPLIRSRSDLHRWSAANDDDGVRSEPDWSDGASAKGRLRKQQKVDRMFRKR